MMTEQQKRIVKNLEEAGEQIRSARYQAQVGGQLEIDLTAALSIADEIRHRLQSGKYVDQQKMF